MGREGSRRWRGEERTGGAKVRRLAEARSVAVRGRRTGPVSRARRARGGTHGAPQAGRARPGEAAPVATAAFSVGPWAETQVGAGRVALRPCLSLFAGADARLGVADLALRAPQRVGLAPAKLDEKPAAVGVKVDVVEMKVTRPPLRHPVLGPRLGVRPGGHLCRLATRHNLGTVLAHKRKVIVGLFRVDDRVEPVIAHRGRRLGVAVVKQRPGQRAVGVPPLALVPCVGPSNGNRARG